MSCLWYFAILSQNVTIGRNEVKKYLRFLFLVTVCECTVISNVTQIIQILKVSSIRRRSLKIIGPRMGKDKKGYHIEDYYEQDSLSLLSSHEEGKHEGM